MDCREGGRRQADGPGALLQTKLHQPPILDVLISILCPTAEAPSSRETRANAVTLLHSRGLDGVRKAVRARLGEVQRAADDQREMSDEGRELCAGAD